MPDLNFGLIQPLPQGYQQIGTVPPQPGGLNSLAGGLAQGLQASQAMQMQRAQNQLAQQEFALKQQMAPQQMQMQQQQIDMQKAALAQAVQEQAFKQQQMQQQIGMQQGLAALAGNGSAQPMPQGMPQTGAAPQQAPQGMAPQGMPAQQQPPMPQQAPQGVAPIGGVPVQGQQPQGAQQPGGVQGYLGGVVDYYKKAGRPDLAIEVLKAQQSLTESTIKNQKAMQEMTDAEAKTKFERFSRAGTIANALINLPDDQAVTLYAKQYGDLIRKIDPQAPAGNADPQSVLAYLHGAAAAGMNMSEIMKANPELAAKVMPTDAGQKEFLRLLNSEKPNKSQLEQVTNYVTGLEKDVNSAIPGSPEQIDAQKKLDFAKTQVKGNEGLMTRLVNAGVDLFTPKPRAAAPGQAPAAIPQGNIKVQSPDGKIGHIPQGNLDAAMKAGFKQVP